MHRLIAFLLLTALPAAAQMQPEGAVIAALSGDWNQDRAPDAVLLVRAADGMADLVVLTGDSVYGLQPLIRLPGLVFSGPMAGQAPELETRSESGFAIVSAQFGVGRTPWSQTISVAFRGGIFVVAGFDYSFYDRLDPSHYGACSVNLLTGHYSLSSGPGNEAADIQREGNTDDRAFALAELEAGFSPHVCDALF